MTGAIIGHYRVLDKIGEGGMGAVWKARDERLGRIVAIKFLARVNEDRRERLILEARTTSGLNHPGIITIHDILDHEGQPCVVMEYIEGRSLNHAIPADGMPSADVIRLGAQIADALAAAHRAGIIHRDLKPANVILTSDGRVKLVDFGLVKMVEAVPNDDATLTAAHGLTTEGMIVGTVNYMSPEQAQGSPVDARSDIFSLGVMLYEMATGRRAFASGTAISTITAILRDEPKPISTEMSGLMRELERVISRCMRKDPERRFQTATDVRNALEELGQGPAPAAPSRSINLKWVLWAMVGLTVAIAGGWLLSTRLKRVPTTEVPLTVRPLFSLPGRKQVPIFSSDGNAVAFAWDGGKEGQNADVYLMQMEGGKPLQITNHPATEWPQSFSPDGRRLYFNRQSEGDFTSYWVPALGGEETRVTEGIVTDISADGRLAAVIRPAGPPANQGVFVLDLQTSAERRVGEDFGAMNPKFSPDGQWLFVQGGRDRDHLSLHRVPVGGGTLEAVQFPDLGPDVDRVEAIEMAPRRARMLIAARGKGTNALISFVATGDGSNPKRLPPTVPPGALSPDGRQMISVRNSFAVKMYRVEAFPGRGRPMVPQKVLDTPNEEYSPKFSPDGSRILLSTFRKDRWEIWLWNAELTEGRPIFGREGGTAGSPTWSPDGKWIAFDARTRNAAGDVWVMPVAGEPKLLADHSTDDITPCFDPAAQWIYFTSSRTGSLELFRTPVSGGPVTKVTEGGGFTCQFSPDGRYIYYLKTRNGGEIWRRDMTASLEEPVVPEMKSRNWKVLRDGIYMLDSQSNSQFGTALRVGHARFYRFATKKIEDMGFRTEKGVTYTGIDISPDEKWLYYSQVDSLTSDLFVTENLP